MTLNFDLEPILVHWRNANLNYRDSARALEDLLAIPPEHRGPVWASQHESLVELHALDQQACYLAERDLIAEVRAKARGAA